ncbi:MAG: hypothetical protein PHX62_04920 [Bacilli bacterium]|nr:hypothetical protein [Bacilli bacterium]
MRTLESRIVNLEIELTKLKQTVSENAYVNEFSNDDDDDGPGEIGFDGGEFYKY